MSQNMTNAPEGALTPNLKIVKKSKTNYYIVENSPVKIQVHCMNMNKGGKTPKV